MDRPASRLALLAHSPSIRLYSQACPGDCPSPQSHFGLSASFHLSVTHSLSLCPSFCLFWFLRPYVPSVSVPSCSGSLSISPPSASPWPSPVAFTLPVSVSPSLQLLMSALLSPAFPSASLSLPLPPAPLRLIPLALALLLPTPPLSLTPGSGRKNRVPGDVEEEPLPHPGPCLLGGAAGLQCWAGPWGGPGRLETGTGGGGIPKVNAVLPR